MRLTSPALLPLTLIALSSWGCNENLNLGTYTTAATMCPTKDGCAGPAPGAPSMRCADGTTAGPACIQRKAGTCEWAVLTCPPSGLAPDADSTTERKDSAVATADGLAPLPDGPIPVADTNATGTDAVNAASCPKTIDEGMGKLCAVDNETCGFSDGMCVCTACRGEPVCGATAKTWHCNKPGATCPPAAPAVATACASEGLTCRYFCDEGDRVCQGNKWTTSGPNCPRSVRSAKRDIAYLTAADRLTLTESLLGIKLATYQYKDPLLAGRRRLGFIIEDSPQVPAVDPEHDAIDLYAYASMLVAATQSQAQEIAALKSDLAAVKTRLDNRKGARPQRR